MIIHSQTDDKGPKKLITEELTELPGMLGLFRKAAVKSNKFAEGERLPMLGNSIHGLKIDRRHLLAYQKLMALMKTKACLQPT